MSCTVSQEVRGDLDVLIVANDTLELAFLPQIGGRLISLQMLGAELLWHNPALLADDFTPRRPYASWPPTDGTMGSWANVGGSKTWPAPQGWSGPHEWPGPPDEVLDAGTYTVQADLDPDGSARVTLISADDPRTGIRIERRFVLPANGPDFTQTSTFVNHSHQRVNWSVWEITQVDTTPRPGATGTGRFLVDVDGNDTPVILFEVLGAAKHTLRPGVVEIPVQETVGKLGFTQATGRLTYIRTDGLQLTQTITREPGQLYPDGGCPVELWLQYPVAEPIESLGGLRPDAHLAEMEVLSPLYGIEPGDRAELMVEWRVEHSG
ncbi:DUF4380 domain-containing protein [Kineosporia mesophila]|uniref:DUF4380 domain-containing protein n=1 Tax=Kineosporia mesophila TaxID=566012 RepID=A0ABP6ZPY3_9ACTN|nr:DUF4380 domain-containing protein [Kineosporia mesophila]MCD5354761.1 DUF4380 domain-containing protein [Kineosporia mesophila]